ncbi:MAG: hypothetical protein ABR503_06230 [Chitinophagaceae bacterium]
MKTRLSKVLNFIAFNLLFFALYLNFVHKDTSDLPALQPVHTNAAIKATVSVKDPEQYLEKAASQQTTKDATEKENNEKELKLSFN